MRLAKVENGIVTNIVEGDLAFATKQALVPCDATIGIGWQYDGTTFTNPNPPRVPTINDIKVAAKHAIDAAAGQARARYITTVPGQEATYMLKERQAREYAAAGYPAASVPPLVQVEADAFGITPQQAADEIIAKADAWIALAAKIEYARRSGKAEVDAASDVASVETIKNKIIAQLDAI